MLFWGLGLLAAALLLIIMEVFIPSGGLISLVAVGTALAGIVCLFRYNNTWGAVGILTMLVLGPAAFGFALRIWPSTPMGRKMLGEISPEEAEAQRLAAIKERERLLSLVGATGMVLTDLRPVGVVQIDGVRHDALSEAGFIPAGTRVKVTVVEHGQIKVRPTV